jgi:hypothetical protein
MAWCANRWFRIVCALNTTNLTTLYPIRSYRARGAAPPPFTILEAARASIASPERFLPVAVGTGHRKVTLVDATTGFANPTKELLQEAQRVFGEDAKVATVVSIGSGKGTTLNVSEGDDENALVEALKRVALNTEATHAELETRLHDAFIYFRFNVDQDLDYGMDASVLHSHTSAYLEKASISRHLDEAMKSIQNRPKGMTIKELSEYSSSLWNFV